MQNYDHVAKRTSQIVTRHYSTSFYLASCCFPKYIRNGIFGIYGFVRFADEIVDSFFGYDQLDLFNRFEEDFYHAYESRISLNPVLHSFQLVMHRFHISLELVQAFLNSMRADLFCNEYKTQKKIDEYIYGSAEVVGLMCLRVFCFHQPDLYDVLESDARHLGAAFQKVNFLRDLKSDTEILGRTYFPDLDGSVLNEQTKELIIADIESDFTNALRGIKRLPDQARIPVYLAYLYYTCLLRKLKKTPASELLARRTRVPDWKKLGYIPLAYLRVKFNSIR